MKSLTNKLIAIGSATLVLVSVMTACNKSANSTGSARQKNLSVYLTDDPIAFGAVFIDIKTVEVKIDEDLSHDSHFADTDTDKDDDLTDHDQYGKWDTLAIRSGVYNIMNFRNGLDTVLATGKIPVGRIEKIRITLGTNNSVVVSNVTYPLLLSPGQNKYLYVKIEENDLDEAVPGQLGLWIDFDLSASIEQIQGSYYLNPCIKAFGMEQFGRMEGRVLPSEANALVKVSNGKDSASAIPEKNSGEFEIRGLPEGSYSVYFKAYNGYKDTTLKNVQVLKGKETELGTVTLHK